MYNFVLCILTCAWFSVFAHTLKNKRNERGSGHMHLSKNRKVVRYYVYRVMVLCIEIKHGSCCYISFWFCGRQRDGNFLKNARMYMPEIETLSRSNLPTRIHYIYRAALWCPWRLNYYFFHYMLFYSLYCYGEMCRWILCMLLSMCFLLAVDVPEPTVDPIESYRKEPGNHECSTRNRSASEHAGAKRHPDCKLPEIIDNLAAVEPPKWLGAVRFVRHRCLLFGTWSREVLERANCDPDIYDLSWTLHHVWRGYDLLCRYCRWTEPYNRTECFWYVDLRYSESPYYSLNVN